jgi:hypothetical protein
MLVDVFGELSEAVSLEFLVLLRILERRDINGTRDGGSRSDTAEEISMTSVEPCKEQLRARE